MRGAWSVSAKPFLDSIIVLRDKKHFTSQLPSLPTVWLQDIWERGKIGEKCRTKRPWICRPNKELLSPCNSDRSNIVGVGVVRQSSCGRRPPSGRATAGVAGSGSARNGFGCCWHFTIMQALRDVNRKLTSELTSERSEPKEKEKLFVLGLPSAVVEVG